MNIKIVLSVINELNALNVINELNNNKFNPGLGARPGFLLATFNLIFTQFSISPTLHR